MKSSKRFKASRGEALGHWNQAIARNPNDTNSYKKRGMYYFHEGDYSSAIEDFNKIIELDSSNANAYDFLVRAYSARGLVYYDRGDDDRAITDFSKAIELDSQNADAYNNRGMAYFRKGGDDSAISDFTQVLQLKPNESYAYFWRGLIYLAKAMTTAPFQTLLK